MKKPMKMKQKAKAVKRVKGKIVEKKDLKVKTAAPKMKKAAPKIKKAAAPKLKKAAVPKMKGARKNSPNPDFIPKGSKPSMAMKKKMADNKKVSAVLKKLTAAQKRMMLEKIRKG